MNKAVQQKLTMVGRISGYVLLALVVFVVGFRVSFPATVIADLLEQQADRAGIHLKLGDASLSGIAGLSLQDVEVGTRQGDFRMHFDRLDASAGLFSLAAGKPHISLEARAGNGHIGPVDVKKTATDLDVTIHEIKDFPLDKVPVKVGRLMATIKKGKGHFRYAIRGGLYQSRGQLDMELVHTGLLNPAINIPGFGKFKLTSIDLGRLNVRIEVGRRADLKALRKYRGMRSVERVINISRLIVNGRDLKLMASPTSTVTIPRRGSLMNGQLNLEIAFHIMNAFFDKKTKIDNKLEQPNKGLRTLLALDPKWKRAWYRGFYGLICTGLMRHPRCFPKRTNQKISYFHLNRKETVPPKAGGLFGGTGKKPGIQIPPPGALNKGDTRIKGQQPAPSKWHRIEAQPPAAAPSPPQPIRRAPPVTSQAVEHQAIRTMPRVPIMPVRKVIKMDLARPMLKGLKHLPKQDDDQESGP